MDVELIILFAVLGLAISFWVATLFKKAAADKGYDSPLYFWVSFLLGAVGWALVIALPDKKLNAEQKEILKKLDKQIELVKNAPKAADFTPETIKKAEEPQKAEGAKLAEESRKFWAEKAAEKAKTVDGHEQKVTALPGTTEDKIVCPVCNQVQNAGRRVCMNCGARFAETNE